MDKEGRLAQQKHWDMDTINEIWGDKEPQVIMDAIRLTSEAYNSGLPISELADKLAERFLIVPGDNEVSIGQLSALINGYTANKEGWDAIVEGQNQT